MDIIARVEKDDKLFSIELNLNPTLMMEKLLDEGLRVIDCKTEDTDFSLWRGEDCPQDITPIQARDYMKKVSYLSIPLSIVFGSGGVEVSPILYENGIAYADAVAFLVPGINENQKTETEALALITKFKKVVDGGIGYYTIDKKCEKCRQYEPVQTSTDIELDAILDAMDKEVPSSVIQALKNDADERGYAI